MIPARPTGEDDESQEVQQETKEGKEDEPRKVALQNSEYVIGDQQNLASPK
jgi:hypothetical protein